MFPKVSGLLYSNAKIDTAPRTMRINVRERTSFVCSDSLFHMSFGKHLFHQTHDEPYQYHADDEDENGGQNGRQGNGAELYV